MNLFTEKKIPNKDYFNNINMDEVGERISTFKAKNEALLLKNDINSLNYLITQYIKNEDPINIINNFINLHNFNNSIGKIKNDVSDLIYKKLTKIEEEETKIDDMENHAQFLSEEMKFPVYLPYYI